jgi:hypothetical protein
MNWPRRRSSSWLQQDDAHPRTRKLRFDERQILRSLAKKKARSSILESAQTWLEDKNQQSI